VFESCHECGYELEECIPCGKLFCDEHIAKSCDHCGCFMCESCATETSYGDTVCEECKERDENREEK